MLRDESGKGKGGADAGAGDLIRKRRALWRCGGCLVTLGGNNVVKEFAWEWSGVRYCYFFMRWFVRSSFV